MTTLRLAEAADAAPIAGLLRRSLALLTFLPDLHTPEEDLAFVRDAMLVEERVTLAEQAGKLLGMMAEHDDWISHLYLEPTARRRGIGSLLLADAKTRHAKLQLWCFQQNRPARAFYERHGFVAAEFTDGAGNEERQPDLRYVWTRPTAP